MFHGVNFVALVQLLVMTLTCFGYVYMISLAFLGRVLSKHPPGTDCCSHRTNMEMRQCNHSGVLLAGTTLRSQ